MDIYSILRQFADSWGLLAMFLFFAGIALYTFRPGSSAKHQDAANIPLRHGDDLEKDTLANADEPTKSEVRT